MHSEKIIKVLGAGLTAAALTLGATAPALAEITIDTDKAELSATVIDSGGSSKKADFTVPVSFESTDKVQGAETVFATSGEGYEQRLIARDKGFANSKVNAAFDPENSGSFSVGSDKYGIGAWLYKGDWDVEKVTVTSSDDDITKSAESLGSFTFKSGIEPLTGETNPAIYADTISADEDDLTVVVGHTGVHAEGDTLKFVYEDPTGEEFEVEGVIKSGSGEAASVTYWYGELRDGLEDADLKLVEGTYKLVRIVATTTLEDEGGKYALESSTLYERDDFASQFKKGDIEVKDLGYEPMFRIYNPNGGEHFYTANAGERDNLVKEGWKYEGIGFYVPNDKVSKLIKISRLYDGIDHHYAEDGEAALLEELGWKNEGVAFYSNETVSDSKDDQPYDQVNVYRLYNPNAEGAGRHFYTTNAGERDLLRSVGWSYEGVGFYGVDAWV